MISAREQFDAVDWHTDETRIVVSYPTAMINPFQCDNASLVGLDQVALQTPLTQNCVTVTTFTRSGPMSRTRPLPDLQVLLAAQARRRPKMCDGY